MIKTKIDHLAFRVTDIDKASVLMQQLGYVEMRRTNHHGGAVDMENPRQPGLTLEFTLIRKERNEKPGFDHACFKLDGQEQLDELVAAGFPATGKTSKVPGSGRVDESWKDYDGIKWQFCL